MNKNKISKLLLSTISSNGRVSSKRLIAILAFILMATGFIANLFWDQTIDEFIYESMKWIVIGGLGFTASERFGFKDKPIKDENKNENKNETTE